MYKKLIIVAICLLFNLSFLVKAADIESFIVPSGLQKDAILADAINIKTAVVGQKIEAILLDDFIYEDEIIVPKESVVVGSIVSYYKSQKADEESNIQIKFTTIRTLYNNIVPISAVINTDDGSGVLRQGNKNADLIIEAGEKINLFFTQPITLKAK